MVSTKHNLRPINVPFTSKLMQMPRKFTYYNPLWSFTRIKYKPFMLPCEWVVYCATNGSLYVFNDVLFHASIISYDALHFYKIWNDAITYAIENKAETNYTWMLSIWNISSFSQCILRVQWLVIFSFIVRDSCYGININKLFYFEIFGAENSYGMEI